MVESADALRKRHYHDELAAFAEAFARQHGVELEFAESAVKEIEQRCEAERLTVRDFCAKHLPDLEFGLKLIARNTGRAHFRIGKRFLRKPAEEMSRLVAQSFNRPG